MSTAIGNPQSVRCIRDTEEVADLEEGEVLDSEEDHVDVNANNEDGSCVYDTSPTLAECVSTVDFDNYTYEVVAIGGQCWFAENLRTSTFQDGTVSRPNSPTSARTTYNANQTVFNCPRTSLQWICRRNHRTRWHLSLRMARTHRARLADFGSIPSVQWSRRTHG